MEEIFAIVLKALSSQKATDILTIVGIYLIAPLVTHINIQFIKYDRRERDTKKLGRWTLRGIAFIMCFGFSLFIAWRVGDWDLDDSLDHAVNIAFIYPLAMWAFMAWLKKKSPDAYAKLKAPRRRKRKDDDNKPPKNGGNSNGDDTLSSTGSWAGET